MVEPTGFEPATPSTAMTLTSRGLWLFLSLFLKIF